MKRLIMFYMEKKYFAVKKTMFRKPLVVAPLLPIPGSHADPGTVSCAWVLLVLLLCVELFLR